MGTIPKVLGSYTAIFGGIIVFLTVLGHWNEVNNFLDNNSTFGFIVSAIYLFVAYIYYDSIDKVAKLQFDKARKNGKKRNSLGHRK